jgi:hypothetical protein
VSNQDHCTARRQILRQAQEGVIQARADALERISMTREEMREKCAKLAVSIGVTTLKAQEDHTEFSKTAEMLESFALSIRNEALEEAAQIAYEWDSTFDWNLHQRALARVNAKIRALKEFAHG